MMKAFLAACAVFSALSVPLYAQGTIGFDPPPLDPDPPPATSKAPEPALWGLAALALAELKRRRRRPAAT